MKVAISESSDQLTSLQSREMFATDDFTAARFALFVLMCVHIQQFLCEASCDWKGESDE